MFTPTQTYTFVGVEGSCVGVLEGEEEVGKSVIDGSEDGCVDGEAVGDVGALLG